MLKKILICPTCQLSDNLLFNHNSLECNQCKEKFSIQSGKVIMIDIENNVINKLPAKEPGTGSFWRRCNWQFNKNLSKSINPNKIVLEIGCGIGYFRPLFGENYIGTDINLYDKADLIADISKDNCLCPESIDVILMNNLLEHVYDYSNLLKNCINSLKKGGILLITVPYSSILHQVPIDFFRFSHYGLINLMSEHNMSIIKLEGVYSPITQLNRSLRRIFEIEFKGYRNKVAKMIFQLMGFIASIGLKVLKGPLVNGTESLLDKNIVEAPSYFKSPIGYQIIAKK